MGMKRPGALLARRTRTVKGWNDTRADPLLPERARSECARSTAAVGPTRVPFQEGDASKLGRRVARQLVWSLCSQSPHDEAVVARCARWRPHQPSLWMQVKRGLEK